ncbi:MAG TPA: tRNA uridine-5-carboxymethylaminomethyl(34) synthesis GTPase MnmE [Syntrophobacteraceae bacterium]|nr:tRNA uridine-5-carboxymethylaminomethyl(34) synthesis GTPase MnmE [Syntrophobacteraceae bacterium]
MHVPFSHPFETICAIATPLGEGGVGILKMSGPDALAIVYGLFRPGSANEPLRPFRLHYGWIVNPATGQCLDEVLVSYMAAPRSYTREDVIEINCHSGFAVLQQILGLLLAAGARLAEPGEFTRRAFLHGRIDLSQAEAVIDIIRSQSDQSLALANQQLRGGLRAQVEAWLAGLTELQAHLEAAIDFADDGTDETALPGPNLADLLETRLRRPLAEMLLQYEQGRIAREGLTLVLVGRPNVGKSSLLNALLVKDRAIVTKFPGTTRDIIEDRFLLSGVMVRILDTAGIRHQPDTIESLGIERTLQALEEADVVLWLVDGSEPLSAEDDQVFHNIADKQRVVLLNKADLPPATTVAEVTGRYGDQAPIFSLSVLDPQDVDQLRRWLATQFLEKPLDTARCGIVPNVRHHRALQCAHEALGQAQVLLRQGGFPELVSIEFQAARHALESIVGRVDDEALLDQIFSQFCVGK